MQYVPNNKTVKLCAKGMELEGEGKKQEASKLFYQAWEEASDDFEKFTAAHYVARHQLNVADKLKWDEIALELAMGLDDGNVKATFPSLYLNIAKCYEDLHDLERARENYQLALSFADLLPAGGYGNMIKAGIGAGIERVK